jgi:hypothetical protein
VGAIGALLDVVSGAAARCSTICELGPLLWAITNNSATTTTAAMIHVVGAQRLGRRRF